VNIENQVWTDKNLEVSTYRNGDSIPFAKTVAEWTAFNNSGTGAYAYLLFANNEAGRTYGKLYNWYAVNDIRGLAPAGYHIPSTLEWTTLRNTQPTDGFTFRSTSNDWGAAFNNYNTGDLTITNRPSVSIGDNSTGFNVLPSGNMSSTGGNPITNAALFWTTDADAANPKNANWFYFTKDNIYNAATQIFTFDKGTGMSVRLVKD
jgi:uncharacterized protein (TIGR02145 family)